MPEVLLHFHGSKLLLVVTMLMVITMQLTLTKAVDIQGFSNPSACSGSGYTFPGIAQRVCTVISVGSFLIRDLPASCAIGRAYSGGGCTTQVSNGSGPTVWCFTGGPFTGAAWYNNCRRRRLQGAEAEASGDRCTHSVAPNGVHHTEDPSKGSWVLKTPNATEALAHLQALLDDAEKVNWLKAQGAYHVPGSDQVTIV